MVHDAIEEIEHEIRKVTRDIDFSIKEQHEAEEHKKKVLYRKMYLEKLEQKKKEQEEAEELRIKKIMEEKHKRELANSCPHGKVRTYACNKDNTRVVKYFNYEYDF